MSTGKFIISLDFEMFWGVKDSQTIDSYGNHVRNELFIVPKLLDLFDNYGISATWAIVGLLFCKDKNEIIEFMPISQPLYIDSKLNPYLTINEIGDNEGNDPYHYGYSLVKKIIAASNQEVATHTFGHYYCLEPGQTIESFQADISSAIKVAQKYNIELKSIIFPRNQYSDPYLSICVENNINIYRGSESHWAYCSHNSDGNTKLKRIFRFFDSYLNLSGHHSYNVKKEKSGLINVPASKFLRPYSNKLKYFECFKLRRIMDSMTYAAKNNQIYHLWWHPHNFGRNIDQNFGQLEIILKHFLLLKQKYNMQSLTMQGIGDLVDDKNE